jgi:NAD(P)-dependent dehydrogenase (short-subunit alcohol dehydrogenase family)
MAESIDYLERFRLRGKVALVTGGSRGLGSAMAEGLAQAGADVVIASRKLDRCTEVAERLAERHGVKTLAYACHLGRWDEIPGLVEAIYDRFGHLDVVVNNAGMSPTFDGLSAVTERLWDSTLALNLKGPFRLCVLAGERMAADRGGSIINVSSMASLRPRPDVAPYGAAKAGLNTLTRALVHAFGPSVRVNGIVPGPFVTDVSSTWSEEFTRQRSEGLALKRLGRPDEIVGAALYLASDASSFTSGTLIQVDGGYPA